MDRTDLLSIKEYVEQGLAPSVEMLKTNSVISDSVGNDLLRKIKNESLYLVEISFVDGGNNKESFHFYTDNPVSLRDCFSALNSKTEEKFYKFGKNGEVYIYDKKIDYASDAKNFVQVVLNGKTLDNEKDVTADLKLKKGDKLAFILDNCDIGTYEKYLKNKNSLVYIQMFKSMFKENHTPNTEEREEFLKYTRMAADLGNADAQNELGVRYYKGEGVEKDHTKAAEWYRKAAEQGLAEAQYNLGLCYDKGEGVEKDHAKAAEWYRKAAEQGYADAQYNLSLCYYNGQGVEKDYTKAAEWVRKAAEQGLAKAQFVLGNFYDNGEGVKKDYAEAVKWYRKSAEQGFQPAVDALKNLK